MSKQNKKTKASITLGPFGGIDAGTSHTGMPTATDVVNFRIEKDGSLIKRYGYRHLISFFNQIRAVWSGKLFGENSVFLLAANTVVRFDPITRQTTAFGTVSQTSGKAQFFFYRDRLYLFANEQIYQIEENSLTPIEAYVPLIGKDWCTTHVGNIFEPRNLLTRRARIEYVVDENFSVFFRTGWPVESIEAVYMNDQLLGDDEYLYDEPSLSIIIQGISPGTRVRVYLTYAENNEPEQVEQLLSCSRVDVFGDSTNNRLFLWNGNQKNLFYPSAYVSSEALAASCLHYPRSAPLYFPAHSECVLGDGRYDITGFVRQYDRLLIFTEGDTWMVDTDALSETLLSAKPIHPLLGCDTVGAYAMAENAPITVCQKDIYQWSTDTDEYSECNAHSILDPIRPLLADNFFSTVRVFHYRARGEIWFYSPTNAQSIWIYRVSDGIWYRFSNILADTFFELGDRLFFLYGRHLYVFDPSTYSDVDEISLSHSIRASYTSSLIDYGTPHDKHFSGVWLSADGNGGTVQVSLIGDGIVPIRVTFSDFGAHSLAYRRLHSGRFRYATLQILADGNQRQIIHSLISDVR